MEGLIDSAYFCHNPYLFTNPTDSIRNLIDTVDEARQETVNNLREYVMRGAMIACTSGFSAATSDPTIDGRLGGGDSVSLSI
jgi:hypothetical protein